MKSQFAKSMASKEAKEYLAYKKSSPNCDLTRRALSRVLTFDDGSLLPPTNSESFVQWQANLLATTSSANCSKSQKALLRVTQFFTG